MKKIFTFIAVAMTALTMNATDITCAAAVEAGNALGDNVTDTTQTYSVVGYVSIAEPWNAIYRSQIFYMADDSASTSKAFEAYSTNTPTDAGVKRGDKVRVTGYMTKYVSASGIVQVEIKNGTCEILQAAQEEGPKEIKLYTVSEFIAAYDAGTIIEGDSCKVVGVISKWYSKSNKFDQYHSVSYFITDGEKEFEMYNSYSLNKAQFATYEFTDETNATCIDENGLQLQIGDSVIGIGTARRYGDTYEFGQNCYLVWTNAEGGAAVETPDIVFEATDFAGLGQPATQTEPGGDVLLIKNGVTFHCDNAYGTDQYGVRCYRGANIKISCDSAKIGKIVFEFLGTYDGGLDAEFIVNANEWSVSDIPSQTRMTTISIYFGDYEPVEIEGLSVAEALAIGALLDSAAVSDKLVIEGYVTNIVEDGMEQYGLMTFWIADEKSSTAATNADGALEIYRGKPDVVLLVGNKVRIEGTITNFKGILLETTAGAKVTKIVEDPAITIQASPANAGSVTKEDLSNNTWKITATPNYGYHFIQWNDGITTNPRTVELIKDTTFTAIFAQDILPEKRIWPIILDEQTYNENLSYVVKDFRPNGIDNNVWIWDYTYTAGDATGLNSNGNAEGYLALVVGNSGWSGLGFDIANTTSIAAMRSLKDSIIANPDNYFLHLAIKSIDNYSHCFYIMGEESTRFVIGSNSIYDGAVYANFVRDGEWYEFYIPMSQFANAFLSTESSIIFAALSEGVAGAKLNLDAVYFCNTAFKEQKCPQYSYIVSSNDDNMGRVSASYSGCLKNELYINAIPNYGYHFSQWSDGVTDNPRTIELTQDTTFAAEFVQYIYPNVKIGDLCYELNTDTKNATVMGLSGGEAKISVTDNSIAEWNNLPQEYVFETKCPNDAKNMGLKSVKVYANPSYINILVEPDMNKLPDLEYVPFHVFIDVDNSDATGGYWDEFIDPNADIMLEGGVFVNQKPSNYNPAVFRWWGEVGGSGWEWIDWNVENDASNNWGAIIGEGQLPVGNSQFVDGKFEIQLSRELLATVHAMNDTEFGIGFDIQQNWSSVGILPCVSPTNDNPAGHANKLKVKIDKNKYYDSDDTISSDLVIPSSVVYKNEAFDVTTIGESAFEKNENITSVTIPNSVTSIGYQAFYGCRNITYFEGSVQAYRAIYSENLKTVIISGGEAEDLSDYWFGGNIQKLDLDALETAFIPSGVLSGHCYLKELILPAHLKSIGYLAVAECLELQEIVIPLLVTEIDKRAFEDCRSLKSVTFEGTALTRIGDWAFYNCHELDSINLPEGLTEIGKAAFYGCIYAENLKVPSSVQSIGDNAFALCSKLNRMDVDALLPPAVEAKTFYEVSREAPVYVPEESVNLYKNDPIWGELNIIGNGNAPQGIDQITNEQSPITNKVFHNGQIYILRGDKVYTVTGQKVR